MFKKCLLRGALGLLLAMLSVAATAGVFTSLTVFGDDLSDGGNDFLYTGGAWPPPPYLQRLSNGPVAVEQLASKLGLALTPSLAGGSNYAYGAAQTGWLNSYRFTPALAPAFSGTNTGVLAQVGGFTAANSLDASSLVVLWAGQDDILSALAAGDNPLVASAAAVNNLGLALQDLYSDGARTILMPNLLDLGLTPWGLGTADAATLTGISVAFNASLHAAIATWRALDPGLTILEFDTFDALRNVTSNPAAFGLTNVSDPCFTGVTVCGDPSQYLYWDSLHPSASGHQILGQALTVAVAAAPEPPIGALMVLAGMGALAARRIGSLRMCCS